MNDLHVLLLQTAPVWNDPDASIAAAAELLQKAETDGLLDGIDLIVLPEMWTTGFNVHEHALLEEAHRGPGQRAMQKWAEQWNCGVLGSLAVQTAEGQRHNRMFFVEPDGNGLHYDKRHLFTRGESPVLLFQDRRGQSFPGAVGICCSRCATTCDFRSPPGMHLTILTTW